MVKLEKVYAIDIAAERGAFELCRLLIHNGACLKPRALICLINDMESHEYYRKKTAERMRQSLKREVCFGVLIIVTDNFYNKNDSGSKLQH